VELVKGQLFASGLLVLWYVLVVVELYSLCSFLFVPQVLQFVSPGAIISQTLECPPNASECGCKQTEH
jgi:hypothetical protein